LRLFFDIAPPIPYGDIVLQLLREGADASLRTECTYVKSFRTARALFTARQIAMQKGLTGCVAAFDTYRCDVEAGRFLRGVGAAAAATDASSSGGAEVSAGRVPDEIVAAAWQGDDAAVLAWLDGGGSVDATFTRDGVSRNTLLMVAARAAAALALGMVPPSEGCCHKRLVVTLLQRRASVNLQNSNGVTALMYAAGHDPADLLRRHTWPWPSSSVAHV